MVSSRKRRWKTTHIIDQNLKIVSLLQISFRKGAAGLKAVWPNDIFTCTSTVSNAGKITFCSGGHWKMLSLVLPATIDCPAMESAADCLKASQTNCFPVRPSPSDRRYRRWYLRKAWHRLGRTCCRGMSNSRLPPAHCSMPSARFFAQDSHSPRIGLQTFLMPESENMK